MPETVHCSLCGIAPSRVLYTTQPRPPFKSHPTDDILPHRIWKQCLSCGLIFLSPRLTSDEAATLYTEEYHDEHSEELRGWEFQKKKELIERHAQPGRLLDVGCGYGYFQHWMGKAWDTMGVELSAAAVRGGRERMGVDIRHGTLKGLRFPAESFDVVTLWDVLEHLPDPVDELRQVHRILAPGGILGISTCDASAVVPRLTRSYWYCINTPDHQYAFTLDWLKLALERTGFDFQEVVIHNQGWLFFKPFLRRGFKECAKAAAATAAKITRSSALSARLSTAAPPLAPMFRDLVILAARKKPGS